MDAAFCDDEDTPDVEMIHDNLLTWNNFIILKDNCFHQNMREANRRGQTKDLTLKRSGDNASMTGGLMWLMCLSMT